mmetsp:Transcript_22907/g.58445  ORF Transcript_22907/g.58445 Transcript_22907/m.58445 type:complete len:272 (+) Transcript_22907:1622-2437(+)
MEAGSSQRIASATAVPASRAGRGAEWLRARDRESASSSLRMPTCPATAPSACGALLAPCAAARSMMSTVMLSWLPACMAALISMCVATRSAASRLTPRASARAMQARAMRTASSLLRLPHSPSLASNRKSSPGVRSTHVVSGVGITPNFLRCRSPMALDMLSTPMTRCPPFQNTNPPAWRIRSVSSGLSGLWSSVRATADPSERATTARLSPHEAVQIMSGPTTQQTAVLPPSAAASSGKAASQSSKDWASASLTVSFSICMWELGSTELL